MKTIEYKVIYLNGNEEIFYCIGFREAIITAMKYAIDKGWDIRIKYIADEDGLQIEDIKIEYQFSI